jgi:hypothetical protein
MEAYSSSVDMPRVVVGGLAGRIFGPGNRRFAGGLAGLVWLDEAEPRHVGGCVGYVSQPAEWRYVGGCVGHSCGEAYRVQPSQRGPGRAHSEAATSWGDEALEGAPA